MNERTLDTIDGVNPVDETAPVPITLPFELPIAPVVLAGGAGTRRWP